MLAHDAGQFSAVLKVGSQLGQRFRTQIVQFMSIFKNLF